MASGRSVCVPLTAAPCIPQYASALSPAGPQTTNDQSVVLQCFGFIAVVADQDAIHTGR